MSPATVLPSPVIAPVAPEGWMHNSASLSEAALAVAGMNYASDRGHNHFAGLRYSHDSAYFPPGAPIDPAAIGIYRHSILGL